MKTKIISRAAIRQKWRLYRENNACAWDIMFGYFKGRLIIPCGIHVIPIFSNLILQVILFLFYRLLFSSLMINKIMIHATIFNILIVNL